jgi:hypothetical protein
MTFLGGSWQWVIDFASKGMPSEKRQRCSVPIGFTTYSHVRRRVCDRLDASVISMPKN